MPKYGNFSCEEHRSQTKIATRTHIPKQLPQETEPLMSDIFFAYEQQMVFALKESSVSHYRYIIRTYLQPYLGDRRTAEMTPLMLEQTTEVLLTGGASGRGLSRKTVRDILSVLRLAIEHGTLCGLYTGDPLPTIRLKQEKRKIDILQADEQIQLIRLLYPIREPSHLGIFLALYMGMRIGEVCALTWEYVDLAKGFISVEHTLLRVPSTDDSPSTPKTKLLINSPKTASSRRRIPIPSFLSEELRRFQSDAHCYVLTGKDTFIEPGNYYKQYRHWLTLSGVSPHSFHALRHTFATNSIAEGFDPKALSELLGHADVRMTLDHYVHPSMALKTQYMERKSELFKSHISGDPPENHEEDQP